MSSTAALRHRPSPLRPELAVLSALVSDIAARPDRWEPHVRFDREQRYWTRLDAPSGVDVWLLSWYASQRTELHDHGDSAAAFTVVRGTLTEVRPTPDGLVSRRFGAGDVQTVAAGEIHDVDNRDLEPAVSIHAYAPRLRSMTYYASDGGLLRPTRTVWTDEPESE